MLPAASPRPASRLRGPRLAAAGVPEYILVAELAEAEDNAALHPINKQHVGYERVLLTEVSRHMLHYSDAVPQLALDSKVGVCCAVAYRRKAPKILGKKG